LYFPPKFIIFEKHSWAAGGVAMVSVEWLNQVHNTKSIFHISKIEIWSNRAQRVHVIKVENCSKSV
jgi:hypothetical protein